MPHLYCKKAEAFWGRCALTVYYFNAKAAAVYHEAIYPIEISEQSARFNRLNRQQLSLPIISLPHCLG